MFIDDLVDHAVFFGLFRIHDEIALDISFDALHALPAVLRPNLLIIVRMRKISLA